MRSDLKADEKCLFLRILDLGKGWRKNQEPILSGQRKAKKRCQIGESRFIDHKGEINENSRYRRASR